MLEEKIEQEDVDEIEIKGEEGVRLKIEYQMKFGPEYQPRREKKY